MHDHIISHRNMHDIPVSNNNNNNNNNYNQTYLPRRILPGERERVGRALDIISASPPSRKHVFYLGPRGNKNVQLSYRGDGKFRLNLRRMHEYYGSREPFLQKYFRVGSSYRFPAVWKKAQIKPSSHGGVVVNGITKQEFLNSLNWFAKENVMTSNFEIHVSDAAPLGVPHPLEQRNNNDANGRHTSLFDHWSNREARRANNWIREHHPRALLHHNIVKEVARRKVERAAQAKARAAHKTKLAALHENLSYRPPSSVFPGGAGFHAAQMHFQAASPAASSAAAKKRKRNLNF